MEIIFQIVGGTNAVGDAFHRIRDGYEDAMVCGGAESCISPLCIGGFTSMKALSTATTKAYAKNAQVVVVKDGTDYTRCV